jgi:glycosyltransferase involved in cell wall biosynthesis
VSRSDISVIILTLNEQKHIVRCISSIEGFAAEIFVVDCYSTDQTCQLAESCGAKVYRHKWSNYASQFNWGLDNLPITTNWIFRLDADEIVTDSLKKQLVANIPRLPERTSGIYVGCRVHFMGQWIRYGSTYPLHIMRLFKFGKGRCENRWMDEHIVLSEGSAFRIPGDIINDNRNNLGWWIEKHNNYAVREAIDILATKYGATGAAAITPKLTGHQEQRKRWLKHKYASLPLFLRPFLYFFYRYIIRLGFLDGRKGLIWHFLQGLWYRFLVDAKIYEITAMGGKDPATIRRVIEREYGIRI